MFRDGKTLQEIGDKYGITRERVRQCLTRLGLASIDGGVAFRSFRKIHDKAEARQAKLDANEQRHFDKWGMSRADVNAISQLPRSHQHHPITKFIMQRKNAGSRGIGWELSFADWWRIWQESGKWEQRGTGKGYCMARWADDGPYSVGNVYICTVGQNFSDSYITKPWVGRFPNGHPGARLNIGTGRGWTFIPRLKKPYRAQICINGKSIVIGQFATPEEAHSAYMAKSAERAAA